MKLLFLNLGSGEVILILLVVVIFFGSKSIPELARGLGKGLREIKDATENIKREIETGAKTVTDNSFVEEEIKEAEKKQQSESVPLDQRTDI